MNRNFQDIPLARDPGVTVATLNLPPGSYLIQTKLRYRNEGGGGVTETASCVYQGDGIGGLDASQQIVENLLESTVDGVLMDFVTKTTTSNPNVHVQCFGSANIHIINTQFVATSANITFQ